VKELLTLFAQGLVKDARRVCVREESMEGVVTLELEVALTDRGRVIGANAARSSAAHRPKRWQPARLSPLEIVE
jgi:hypothetical protein